MESSLEDNKNKIQNIFQSNEFNNSDIYELKEKYAYNEEIIKELIILKEIHSFINKEINLTNFWIVEETE